MKKLSVGFKFTPNYHSNFKAHFFQELSLLNDHNSARMIDTSIKMRGFADREHTHNRCVSGLASMSRVMSAVGS